MRAFSIGFLLLSGFLLVPCAAFCAEVPEHFYNAPENLDPDPNYTPGDFPLGEVHPAKTVYYQAKAGLAETREDSFFTLGTGEIRFSSTKNETASVLGYFRNYFGALTVSEDGPERMEIVIDVNSLDTAVPGRNNRILMLFFQSLKPELGTATVIFNAFDLGGRLLEELYDGDVLSLQAMGYLTLNGVTQPVKAELMVSDVGGAWVVETEEPLPIRISDYGFGDEQIYGLIRSCNHQSLGNTVEVDVTLYLR